MACFKRIVKMLISKCFNNINHARNVIDRYIHFYNNYRPHMSIGYKTPAQVHLEEGEQKRMWKQVKYTKIFY